jgi:ankyrin repeat protein
MYNASRLIILCTALSGSVPWTLFAQTAPSAPEALITAAMGGDVEEVKAMVTAGADVATKTNYGETALMAAALKGCLDCLNVLIAAKANVNATNKDGNTALHFAALRGGAGSVRILIAAKAEVQAANRDGDTALTLAARKPDTETVKLLLAAGADANAQEDTQGKSALMEAASTGSVSAVETLIAAGANANLRSNGNVGPHGRASDLAVKFPAVLALLKTAEATAPQSTWLDGKALESDFAKQGLDRNLYIGISSGDLGQTTVDLDGAKFRFSPERNWDGPVTLRGFDASGEAEFAVGTMVVEADRSGNPTIAQLPIGAGTIVRVFGRVQLFGNVVEAEGTRPLIFLIHNTKNTDRAKPDFTTSGTLSPVAFKFVENTSGPIGSSGGDVVLQMVHLSGTGSAKLKRRKDCDIQVGRHPDLFKRQGD